METYPQVLLNIRVKEQKDLKSLPAARQAMAEAERRLGPRGRLLVRYSGTEPKLRIMAEGEDQGLIDQVAQELAQALDIQLN
jgi:phosphoglucosamine mutase